MKLFDKRTSLLCQSDRALTDGPLDMGRRSFISTSAQLSLSVAALALGLSACEREAPSKMSSNGPAADGKSPDSRIIVQAQNWIKEAGGLVESASSNKADARDFKDQVKRSRESLRSLILSVAPDNRARFQDMVLMLALLDAAAACHKGGFIICPPDLMQQMRAQQGRLQAQVGVAM